MSACLPDIEHEFRRHKALVDKALSDLTDDAFFARPAPQVNPIALIVKHLGGNLLSRWTDFLSSDGEKPWRQRDREFVLAPEDSRTALLALWERGWQALFDTLGQLREADLDRTVFIRGEPHSVLQALLRGVTHAAYHAGQILYLARLTQPERPWLTIAPGQSEKQPGRYLGK